MNWIPITLANLEDAKLAKLVTALRTKALKETPPQDDPTPRVTQKVVDRIRRKIASNRRNRLDADTTTIPKGLLDMGVDFVLAELKGRLEMTLTPEEVERIARHETDLNRIASGTDVVEQPDDAIDADVQETSGSPTISHCRREERNRRRH